MAVKDTSMMLWLYSDTWEERVQSLQALKAGHLRVNLPKSEFGLAQLMFLNM